MGEQDDGAIFWEGVAILEVIPELLVDEAEGTEHLSLGAKGDSGTGVWRGGPAQPPGGRTLAPSASMHHPPVGHGAARPRPPPRQRAWPASGCHGPGVQLRPACPFWNNGEACWGVWGRERERERAPFPSGSLCRATGVHKAPLCKCEKDTLSTEYFICWRIVIHPCGNNKKPLCYQLKVVI